MTELCWPASRLGEALHALARHGGLTREPAPLLGPAPEQYLDAWLETAAGRVGCEAEAVQTPYAELGQMLRRGAPALLRLFERGRPIFLALVAGKSGQVTLLTPQGELVRTPVERVHAELCRDLEKSHAAEVEQWLSEAGLRGRHCQRIRRTLLQQALGETRIGGCWLIRPRDVLSHARALGLPRLLATLLAAHLGSYAMWMLSWWLLGFLCLQGRLSAGWLIAWLLLLATLVPLRLVATWAAGRLSIDGAALLKRTLLQGALALDPDQVRHLGIGKLLGRVIESEVVETLALSGGFLGLTAALELVLAILVFCASSFLHVVLLAATLGATALLLVGSVQRRRRWTRERLDMTESLIECMVGQRTRLAQQPPARWHAAEDPALEHYLGTSAELDRGVVALHVALPRGWFVVALLGLAPAFVSGTSAVALAVTVGGIVVAHRALRNLAEGLERLGGVWIAWERVGLFWRAAQRPEPVGAPGHPLLPAQCKGPLLDVRNVIFRHGHRAGPVLDDVSLSVRAGERILVEGASGAGKSALAALLAGARAPAAGALLLHGRDLGTLGAAHWRRRVVLVPPYHDNHIVMGTFAFNVLLGRGWPPRPADLSEAEQLCRDLELGPLLDRMPAGLHQIIGETGWQLSHGERSRVYIARALLQESALLILDESFAALDPATLRRVLALVLERASTLMVIAHP